MKYREYDFKEIEKKALTDRTKDAIAELGKWYESNGNDFWNGEHYYGSYNGQEYRLTPIMKCVDEENEEWEQIGWELD